MVPIYFVLFILLLNPDKVYVNFQAVELEEHKQILEEFELFLANYTFWNKVEQDLNFIHDKEEKVRALNFQEWQKLTNFYQCR